MIEEGERRFSMLGLGDIVIPGIFIALMLRYDVFLNIKNADGTIRNRYFNSGAVEYYYRFFVFILISLIIHTRLVSISNTKALLFSRWSLECTYHLLCSRTIRSVAANCFFFFLLGHRLTFLFCFVFSLIYIFYFLVMIGYFLGLVTTIGVMYYFKAAQVIERKSLTLNQHTHLINTHTDSCRNAYILPPQTYCSLLTRTGAWEERSTLNTTRLKD